MEQINQPKLQESDNTKYTFYWMCWKNSERNLKEIMVEESKMAIYVELYQLKGVEVHFKNV